MRWLSPTQRNYTTNNSKFQHLYAKKYAEFFREHQIAAEIYVDCQDGAKTNANVALRRFFDKKSVRFWGSLNSLLCETMIF